MNKQVLIVDDSPIMRTLLTEVLRNDYTIKSTGDGIEALEFLLQAEPVDALILDLSMPGMGGVDLLKRVRSMAAFASLPVMVLSGHFESLTRMAALEAGASDFMTKPFNPLELKLRLSRLLPQQNKSEKQSGYASVIKMMRNRVQAI